MKPPKRCSLILCPFECQGTRIHTERVLLAAIGKKTKQNVINKIKEKKVENVSLKNNALEVMLYVAQPTTHT